MNTEQQSSINPVFAGHAAQQLQEATGGIQRVFDNLLEIARGNDPNANGYDRIRATRVLYDRGFGKVTKNPPRTPSPESEQDPESGESGNHTNHSSEVPKPATAAAASNRPVARLEQKLDDTLGPPQAPAQPNGAVPTLSMPDPTCSPDLVREAQYYVLEITNYGAELASILAYIHEPDPEDTTIRACHRITAGRTIIDRVHSEPSPISNSPSTTGKTHPSNPTGRTSTPPRSTPPSRSKRSSRPTAPPEDTSRA